MERKLIKQGGGGFTIYLPKKWVQENKLSKGDELSINISGKDLIISSKPSHKKSESEITLTNLNETTINTLVTDSYRSGYDKIKVNYLNESQYDILKRIVRSRMIGFEIIKKEKNYCIIESVTEPSSENFDNILRKMFMNIEELLLISKSKLARNYDTPIENFNDIEELIRKYYYFCMRIIIKQKLIKKNSEFFLGFLLKIYNAHKEIYYLNLYLEKVKSKKHSKEIMDLLDISIKMFKLIMDSYYEKDLNKIAEVHELQKDAIFKKSYNLFNKNKEGIACYHIASCIRNLHLSTGSLVGLIV